jgi:hypothetical protein
MRNKIFRKGLAVTMPTNERLAGNVAILEKVGLHYGKWEVDDSRGLIRYPGLDHLTLEVPLSELKPCSFSIECVLTKKLLNGKEELYGKNRNPNTTNLGAQRMAAEAVQEAVQNNCLLTINLKQI